MSKLTKNFEWHILLLLIVMMLAGVFFIYTASTTKIGEDFSTKNYYLKQLIWMTLSLLIMFTLIKLPSPVLDILIVPGYIFTILLLIAVLFTPKINGSHRWFAFSGISFQPSELAKLTSILLLGKVMSKPHISEYQLLLRSFGVVILPVIFILMEPDLGTSLTFFVILFAMLAVSDLPFFFLVLIISPIISIIASFSWVAFTAFILLLLFYLFRIGLSRIVIGFVAVVNSFIFFIAPVMWNGMHTYQQNRILTFINPMRDPLGAGYQIIQSRIAIGSGGLMGKGLLMGTQKNLNFLPEHHTDFIFSVIGEEFGFLGCLIMLIFYFLFLILIARSIGKLKRSEKRYAAYGILAYLSFQVFINVGMNIGIVPTTGIPLPFISYGGSNLLMNVFSIGIILKYLNERSIFA